MLDKLLVVQNHQSSKHGHHHFGLHLHYVLRQSKYARPDLPSQRDSVPGIVHSRLSTTPRLDVLVPDRTWTNRINQIAYYARVRDRLVLKALNRRVFIGRS